MARVIIQLEQGECVHDIRERLSKGLADDEVLESTEKYNDSLMADLEKQAEKIYSKTYLQIIKDVVDVLKQDLGI